MKKDAALMFCLTSNHAFALGTVLVNLKAVSPRFPADIIVIHDGISKRDMDAMRRIMPVHFRKYSSPFDKLDAFNNSVLSTFSPMVFAKFEAFKLLSEYRTVLYSDYDIVILDDFSELLMPSVSGARFIRSIGATVADQVYAPVAEYDMHRECVCASLFCLNENLKQYERLYSWCYEKALQYGKNLRLGEQAILDFMFQEFDITIDEMEQNIYSWYPNKDFGTTRPKVLHAWGQPKYWNGLDNELWNDYYGRWVAMGGSTKERRTVMKCAVGLLRRIKKVALG